MQNAMLTEAARRVSLSRARALGRAAGADSVEHAEATDPDFSEKALAFIVDHVRQKGEVPGESITLAAVKAGISPPDQRAFGPIYAMALRRGLIHIVRYIPRVRGHGSAGGKLYAAGANPNAIDA
jgi:predicted DNA-binding transcriptional regulator YafY